MQAMPLRCSSASAPVALALASSRHRSSQGQLILVNALPLYFSASLTRGQPAVTGCRKSSAFVEYCATTLGCVRLRMTRCEVRATSTLDVIWPLHLSPVERRIRW
jgi:hypothetical protein